MNSLILNLTSFLFRNFFTFTILNFHSKLSNSPMIIANLLRFIFMDTTNYQNNPSNSQP